MTSHAWIRRLAIVLLLTLTAPAITLVAQRQSAPPNPSAPRAERMRYETDNEALQKVAPVKVFDNLYYVGVGSVAAWLVTTSEGMVLIDAVDARYADHLLDGIRTLGFDSKNVRYAVITQAHADHFGAAARLQDAGARVAMGEADWAFLAGPGSANLRGSQPPRRDMALKDGETLNVGGNTFRFHGTPGHTPGTTSVEFTVYDGGRPYQAFFMGGVAPAQGVPAGEQAVASIERVERIQDRIQVRLVTHPWMDPMFWDRFDQLAQRKPGQPNPLISNAVFRAYVQALKGTMQKNLEAQRAKAASSSPPAR